MLLPSETKTSAKALKELISGLENKFTSLDSRLLGPVEANRSTPGIGFYLDDKAHNSSPRPKSLGLPRIGSPSSYAAALDRELTASPSLTCVDGAASIALLEKVLREMATREGQDKIMNTLEAVKSQTLVPLSSAAPAHTAFDPNMMAKLEDIIMFMKDMKEESGSRALVRSSGRDGSKAASNLDLYLDADSKSGLLTKGKTNGGREDSRSVSEVAVDEIVTMLKSVKQSLAQGGGLTNEVKLLVRELRGEVLGMGREIAKKLEQRSTTSSGTRADVPSARKDEVALIVQDGLAELKEHMQAVVQETRERSVEVSRPVVDTQEIVRAVSGVLAQMSQPAIRDQAAEREEMLVAVKEAWEDCKPEIALEHFGLERDEIMETLKEGLKSYQPQQTTARDAGATYEDVLEAVRKGLSDFELPQMPSPPDGITRDEVLAAVHDGLRSIEWPKMDAPQQRDIELTKDDVFEAVRATFAQNNILPADQIVEAVREGLAQHQGTSAAEIIEVVQGALARHDAVPTEQIIEAVKQGLSHQEPVAKEIEFNREDLFDAIKACLEGEQNPLGGMGEQVVEAMHEFLGSMKNEFQEYSAANGKDTEQVLDALKDGLEDLRADIESYVDRAADVTGKGRNCRYCEIWICSNAGRS